MRNALHNPLLLTLPVLITAPAVIAIAPSAWPAVLITALSVLVPAWLVLRKQRTEDSEFSYKVLNVIPHPIFIKDADSRYVFVNNAFCEEHCMTLDQVIHKTTKELGHDPNSSDAWRQEDLSALAGETVRVEKHERHPIHGGERHRLIIKGACHTAQGKAYVVGINFDISRWWVTEQDLQQELIQERASYQQTFAFVQRVIDLIPHPVYVKDAEGYCVIANSAMVRERGMVVQQLTGSADQSDTESAAEDIAVLQGSSVLREAHDVDTQTGTERAYIISKGTCLDANGEPVIVGVQVDLTELRQAERKLQLALENEVALRERTEAFIQRLIDVIPDPVFIKKAGGYYVMVNEAFAQYRNVDKLTWRGFNRHEPSPDPALRAESMNEDEQVLAGIDIDKEDHTIRQATGEETFRVISKRRSVFMDGEPVIVGIEHHITRWKLAERELNAVLGREVEQRQRTERFVQDLIDVIPDPVYVKNADGSYIIFNEAFIRYRQQPREQLLGLKSRDLTTNPNVATTSESEDQRVIAGETILKEQHATLPVTGEECFRIVSKRRCINVDGSPVIVGIDHYITEMRQAERELKRLAEEDALTGIANRRHFNIEATRALERAHRHGEALAIVMIDLDHFKHINDHYGHNVGDEVLREMSQRMRDSFRKSDLPGRWGGEEFIALLPHTTLETAQQVAERLRAQLADKPVSTSSGDIQVTLSGGIAQRQDADTLEGLVGRADAALYRAKNSGRNRVMICTERVVSEPDAASTAEAK